MVCSVLPGDSAQGRHHLQRDLFGLYASLVEAQIEARRKPRGIRASNIGEEPLVR
jgi:hypothetical protein